MIALRLLGLLLVVAITSPLLWLLGLVSSPYGDLDGWRYWR